MRSASLVLLTAVFLASLFSVGVCPRALAQMRTPEALAAPRTHAPAPVRPGALKAKASCSVIPVLSEARATVKMARGSQHAAALLPDPGAPPAHLFSRADLVRSHRDRLGFPRPRSDGEPGRPREP